MATVNNRVHSPQAAVINGIDAGGLMRASIQEGFENVMRSSPDGLQIPIKEKEVQFCRGSIETQNWSVIINLLTGTLGTYVFSERKSGAADATGWILHTLTNPVINKVSLNMKSGGYASVTAEFECRAASDTSDIAAMHAMTDSQAAPTYVAAVRGGFRIVSAAFGGTLNIKHVTGLTLNLAMPIVKACNDGDLANTAVDAVLSGMTADGSISFQDSKITTAKLISQQLLLAVRASLVVTVKMAEAAANKVLTIAGVEFTTAGLSSNASGGYSEYTANFEISNNTTTQLTLSGANKILAIA